MLKAFSSFCLSALIAASFGLADARAQNVTGTFGNPKADNAREIYIESDTMEVEQKANRATFVGHVDATRGTVRMRSSRLVVNFKKAAKGAKAKTELTKLDARGNVVVTSKGQRATSDWAIMLVQANKVTMGGNVVLTEGKTVIKGNKLELDLNTGKSRLFGGGSSGRVKGVFLPSQKK